MTGNYEVVFQIEKACARSITKNNPLSDEDMDIIMNKAISYYENGIDSAVHEMNRQFCLSLNLESTLYIIKLGLKKRALVSIDADEIYDKLIVTLWGYTANHDFEKVFRSIGESMYKRYLQSNRGEEL